MSSRDDVKSDESYGRCSSRSWGNTWREMRETLSLCPGMTTARKNSGCSFATAVQESAEVGLHLNSPSNPEGLRCVNSSRAKTSINARTSARRPGFVYGLSAMSGSLPSLPSLPRRVFLAFRLDLQHIRDRGWRRHRSPMSARRRRKPFWGQAGSRSLLLTPRGA